MTPVLQRVTTEVERVVKRITSVSSVLAERLNGGRTSTGTLIVTRRRSAE
ncbi:MAG: hypothetical protein ABI771_13150 [Betaproteobacteria bacterium]